MSVGTYPVGSIETGYLAEFWGQQVTVKKSARATRYPLYLSTRSGPVHFNSQAGQDFLLNYARIDGQGRTEREDAERDQDAPPKPAAQGAAGATKQEAPMPSHGERDAGKHGQPGGLLGRVAAFLSDGEL